MTQQTQKLTAVEWFYQRILAEDIKEVFEQAKAIEKEQIEEAFSIGEMNNDSHHYTGRKIHQDQKDYFNKTYNK
jgi:transposase